MNLAAALRHSTRHDAEPCGSGRHAACRCSLASRAQSGRSHAKVAFVARQRDLARLGLKFSGTAHRRRAKLDALAGQDFGSLVSSQDEFDESVRQKPVVVVDWMARWCRKCIYLKPKLAKMLEDEFPGIPVVFIDVNAVPGDLVYDQGIRKMPTITIYKDGQKVREHVAAEGGLKAVTAIRDMVREYVDKENEEA